MKRIWKILCLVMIGLILAGCGMQNVEISQPSQILVVVTQLVTVIVVVSATPEAQTVQSTPLSISESPQDDPWVLPAEAVKYVGRVISARVENAWCSFQSNLNDTPTFCNDQPYPNHNFTFLVWGEDLSSLDQTCVMVEGLVELYQAKPQIVISDPGQVSSCVD